MKNLNTRLRPPATRRGRLAVVAGAAALAGATAAIPASAAPASAAPKATAAPQMHQLDFLVGRLDCLYSDGITLTAHTRPILGGNYVQMNITSSQTTVVGSSTLKGRWILGWDPVGNDFTTMYYDDGPNQGTSTSPGWQSDGHFVLTGTYSFGQKGVDLGLKDDFVASDANHFTIYESGMIKGAWRLLDTQACTRTPESQSDAAASDGD